MILIEIFVLPAIGYFKHAQHYFYCVPKVNGKLIPELLLRQA